ncbi:MAG: efflux RND transporter periplasmic adaptor subunit [Limnohabitans sp.]
MRSSLLAILWLPVMLAACKPAPAPSADSAAPAALILGAEDVLVLGQATRATGPVISGSIQAERKADLRAEIAAVVTQALKDNGDAVRKGELLISLDASVLRDNLASAEESARTAAQSLDSAERQLQRLKSLQNQGMVSMQALEESEVRRNSAQSEVVAARARVASARQQLERTEIRAPFAGVISARKVSAGDNVQMGRELVQVIDPASTRFEGWVAADQASALRAGQAVTFRINGWSQQSLQGTIRRIDAAANPLTRQVGVFVDFAPAGRPPVVGLYAEGHVQAGAGNDGALTLPDSALVMEGPERKVWKILADGTLQLQSISLGERNARQGQWPVDNGLQAGDRVILHPGSQLKAGMKTRMRPAAAER